MFVLSCAFVSLVAVAAVYQESKCANAFGNCMSAAQYCSGKFVAGYCPTQPINIKCCVPKCGQAKVTAKKVLGLAAKEDGYKEEAYNKNKYADEVPGLDRVQNQPWCDIFVSWCFCKAGQLLPVNVKSAGVAESRDAWKSAKRFSRYPAIGAQVIFGRDGNAHTGLVERYDKIYIYTIEGNTLIKGSNIFRVARQTRNRTDPYVYGYGYPDYSTPIVSADPAWGGTPVASV